MALEIQSVNPPSAFHLKDGDGKSTMACDLEDGEIEDGEIPDEEIVSGGQAVVGSETEKLIAQPVSEPVLLPVQKDVRTHEVKLEVSSSKLKQPIVNRSSSGVNNKHVDCRKESTVEDDWAGDVEKAIKAAMSSTDGGKELKVEVNECGGNLAKAEDDDERKSRRKKRKKKHREDDDERKEAKKQKRSHGSSKKTVADETMDVEKGATSGQEEEDDDEMLYVRGASPIMRSGYNSPSHVYHDEPFAFIERAGPFEDPYDSCCDDSDYEREDFVQSQRGDEEGPKRGDRGAKRRQQGRGGGRGLQNKRQQVRRKDAAGSKGKRIGNKRQQQRTPMLLPDPRQGPDSICMFYMQGKCQKGDECPYSHDALPPRKMELCKFYLMDCCAKKDKCLYMHSDFPCKFYHTGLKCFAGERCKFSHGTLTEPMKAILLKHLETAPKEILGDFPRLSREGAAAMVLNKKNRGNKGTGGPGTKKIPSLFEIEVPIPAQLLAANLRNEEERSPARRATPMPDSDNEDQDGSRTPMPSPPKLDIHNVVDDFSSRGSNRQWDADNGARPADFGGEEVRHARMFRGGTDVKREPSEEQEVTRRPVPSYKDQDFSEQLQQLKMRFYKETLTSSDEVGGNMEMRHQRRRHHRRGKNKTVKDSEQKTDVRSKLNLHYLAGYSPAPAADVDDEASFSRQEESKVISVEAVELADDEGKLEIDDRQEEDDNEGDDGGGDDEDDDDDDDDLVDGAGGGGGVSQPVASTPQPESNKKDQLDTDSTTCNTETGSLPHNLPKKQRELFLRIQQQQREAADSSSQDQSEEDDGKHKDVEKQQEENWYSSDEEEASLADVLKNLSKQQQQSASPTRASASPPVPATSGTPSFDSIKLSAIDISESVSKLLSSIRHQQSASAVNVTQAAENLDPRTSAQSQVAVAAATQARDPRLLSRDPRNRSANTTTSMLSPTTRTSKRVDSSEERNELCRTSIYSSAITSSSVAATNMTHGRLEGGGDVDLRSFHTRQPQSSTGFESRTDVDLRQNMLAGASSYNYGDTDLRGGGSDVDLRGMLGLPFKPVPMHTPATEIDASLTSHPPIPYKVVTITIPRPDYSGLKLNTSDPQVWNDPRLRKLFKVSSNSVDSPASPPPPLPPPKQSPSPAARNDPRRRSVPEAPHSSSGTRLHETAPVYSEMISQNPMSLVHGTGLPPSIVPSLPAVLPYDPRHPRNPRNAPGILGPAPLPLNYCPNTPRFEDLEEGNSNGSDTDLRMFYGNNAPMWEQQLPQPQSQRVHRNRNWRNSRRNQQRFQSQQREHKRSFTPPL